MEEAGKKPGIRADSETEFFVPTARSREQYRHR
jgi:hypothetical protein